MHIINTLLPVFLIIALGALLRKTKFVSAEFIAGLNRLVFWIGLPCLLFYKVATAGYDYRLAGRTTLVMIAGMLSCTAIAYIVAFIIRIPARVVGTFVQGTFRGNLYYVGLALIIYSFAGADSKMSADMENVAILVMALLIPVYNIGSVIVLLASQHKLDRYVPLKITRQAITNPLFLACAAGVVYSQIFPPLPLVITRTFSAVGQVSLPLALIGIGAVLVQSKIAGCGMPALAASIIKIGVSPVVGFWVANLMGLGAGETKIVLLFLACPTAVTSYVMAEQLGGDDKLSAAIIVVSTILSIFSLSVVIGLF
jgi:predicted permease